MKDNLTMAEYSVMSIFFNQYEVALNVPHATKEIQTGIDLKGADTLFWPADDFYRKGRRVLGALIRKNLVKYDTAGRNYDVTADGLEICRKIFGDPYYYGNLMRGTEIHIGSQSFQVPAERLDEGLE